MGAAIAAEVADRLRQGFSQPLGVLQQGPADGEARFLVGFGGQCVELGEMVAQQLFLLAARGEEPCRCGLARQRLPPVVPGSRQAGRPDRVVGKGVEDRAMVGRLEQPALLELALDLDQAVAELAQQPDTRRLVVDKGAAAPIGREQPPQNDSLAGILAPGRAQDRVGRVVAPDCELGRHRRLLGAGPHQPCLRPPAERQAERIQEDRLAGPGLAGQHAQAPAKDEGEPVDQDDIADGQAEQHCGDDTSAAAAKPAPGRPRTIAAEIPCSQGENCSRLQNRPS